MTLNDIILNAVWINEKTIIIIKYQDTRGVVHTLADGAWFRDQILYWGAYRVIKLVMDFNAGEAVFYIV